MSKSPNTPIFDHQDLFRRMPVPRMIVQPEENGAYRVIECNDAAMAYFDKSEEQIVGHHIKEFMSGENIIHFEQTFEVAAEKGRVVTIHALPGVPGHGSVYGFLVNPMFDEKSGDVTFLDVVGQPEIADQSMVQRERDDAVSLMTSVFDVSEIPIVVTDHNGYVVRVNDSFIRTFGWDRDEMINSEVASFVTPDERELAVRNHEQFIRNGGRASGEMTLIKSDGSIANALFTTATLELSQKRRFQVTTVMDITLRKQMEHSLRMAKEQADTANRAKSAFLANMSHELRTPLNAILGFSEMMINHTFGPLGHDKYDEYMTDVHVSAGHLLEIINEVLDMSKIEAGRIELDESEIDMSNVLGAVTRMMVSRVFDTDIEIQLNIEGELPNLRGDQRLVRQILINLITNAVKFSKDKGLITITAGMTDHDEMHIAVKDQGVGIPKEKIEQAMQPFGQVFDRAENTHEQGTGLGLPLAKAMVEMHQGTLRLESDVGEGTNVLLYFPPERILQKPKAI